MRRERHGIRKEKIAKVKREKAKSRKENLS